jgi:hypothetical protein
VPLLVNPFAIVVWPDCPTAPLAQSNEPACETYGPLREQVPWQVITPELEIERPTELLFRDNDPIFAIVAAPPEIKPLTTVSIPLLAIVLGLFRVTVRPLADRV